MSSSAVAVVSFTPLKGMSRWPRHGLAHGNTSVSFEALSREWRVSATGREQPFAAAGGGASSDRR